VAVMVLTEHEDGAAKLLRRRGDARPFKDTPFSGTQNR